MAMKRLNPDYAGFRGYDQEPGPAGEMPMAMAVCSVCGRRRNVPVGVAQEQGEAFVCLSCQREQAQSDAPSEPAEGASEPAEGAGEPAEAAEPEAAETP